MKRRGEEGRSARKKLQPACNDPPRSGRSAEKSRDGRPAGSGKVRAQSGMGRIPAIALAVGLVIGAIPASAREPGEPIRLVWMEGDIAGQSPILGPNGGAPIGVVEYHQHRRGDEVEMTRVSRFKDGSSDEDTAVALAGRTLQALRGRSIIRDKNGRTLVDLKIDVPGGRVTGFYSDDGARRDVDMVEHMDAATYWGPLIFTVVRNFDANAEDDRVRFRTIAPTPRPRLLTMEVAHIGQGQIQRMGRDLTIEHFTLRPTFGWMVDPIVHRLVPSTEFLVEAGSPPSLARYTGPRNYQGQEIRLE